MPVGEEEEAPRRGALAATGASRCFGPGRCVLSYTSMVCQNASDDEISGCVTFNATKALATLSLNGTKGARVQSRMAGEKSAGTRGSMGCQVVETGAQNKNS